MVDWSRIVILGSQIRVAKVYWRDATYSQGDWRATRALDLQAAGCGAYSLISFCGRYLCIHYHARLKYLTNHVAPLILMAKKGR